MSKLDNLSPELAEDPNSGLILGYSPDEIAWPYLMYDVSVEVIYDAGVTVALPADIGQVDASGSPITQNVAIIQTTTPSATKIVRFTLARLGAICELPNSTPGDGEVLTQIRVRTWLPDPDDDSAANFTYRAEGEYHYAIINPSPSQISSLTSVPTPVYGGGA